MSAPCKSQRQGDTMPSDKTTSSKKFDPRAVDPDFTQLDATKLARCLGVSTWVVKGMKVAGARAGNSPFVGRYITLRHAAKWLEENPGFVASHHLRRKLR